MKTPLEAGESVLKEGPANLQRGRETVGGRLFLTERRLVFESHAFNLQTGTTQIALGDIRTLQPCWTRFLNLIPLFPNSLAVGTSDAGEHKFVLFARMSWLAAIEAARQKKA